MCYLCLVVITFIQGSVKHGHTTSAQVSLFYVKYFVFTKGKVLHTLKYFFMIVIISTSYMSIFTVGVYNEVALKHLTRARK